MWPMSMWPDTVTSHMTLKYSAATVVIPGADNRCKSMAKIPLVQDTESACTVLIGGLICICRGL